MNKMKCQIKDHNEKEILTICCDKNCKNKRFCCLSCIKKFHSTHADKLVDVDDMNAFIKKESSKQVQDPQTYNQGQKQILQGLEQLKSLIDSLQKVINGKIEQIKQSKLQDILKKATNCQQGIEYWNQLLEDMLQYVKVDNSLINLIPSEVGQLNEMEEGQIKIIQQSKLGLQQIINQITQPSLINQIPIQSENKKVKLINVEAPIPMKIGRLCFDQKRKHKSIKIIDQNKIEIGGVIGFGLAFLMAYAIEGFDPSKQNYAFAFYMNSQAPIFLFGVGNDEVPYVPNYYFDNINSIGHGQYMMSNMGWTCHHTNQELNNKNQGKFFMCRLKIKYDHTTQELEFRQGDEVFKMKITDMSRKLYPCVGINGCGGQVQLVDY